MPQLKVVDSNGLLYYHQKLKTALANKVDKISGYSLMSDTEIARLANVVNYNDTAVQSAISSLQSKVEALESGTYDDSELRGMIAEINSTLEGLEPQIEAAYTHSQSAHAPASAQENTIESIKVNGSVITPVEKAVDITIPTSVSQLSDAGEYVTDEELSAKGYATAANVYTKTQTYSKDETYSKIEIDNKMTKAVHYKGSVETYANLPENPQVGDMYNIKQADSSHGIKAGDNVVWDDVTSTWDNQGGVIDLSGCISVNDVITNEDIDTIWAS